MEGPTSLIVKPDDPWARLEKYSIAKIFGACVLLAMMFGVGIVALLLAPVFEASILVLMVIIVFGSLLALPGAIIIKRILKYRQRHRSCGQCG
jgi:Ca2+/Na+ antiporter